MLTESAFNALLKTLEEPPEHVIFILATTEPEKIPATILSRCMRFDFKLIETSSLVKHLKTIFDKIGISYQDDAVDLIAMAGKGSVRDTLSIAELCKSFSDKTLTAQNVAECLGYTDSKTINKIATAIIDKNGREIIAEVENLYKSGKNLSVLVDELCDYFKNVLIVKIDSNYNLNVTNETLQEYLQLAKIASQENLLSILKTLSTSSMEIKTSSNEQTYVLATLLGLFYDQNLQIENLKTRLEKLENQLQNFQISDANLQKNVQNYANFQQKTENLVNANKNLNAPGIFGELIKHARENGEQILHQCFGDVKGVKFDNEKFVFVCSSDDAKKIVENRKEFVLNFLKSRYNICEIGFEVFVDKDAEFLKKLNIMLDDKLEIKK